MSIGGVPLVVALEAMPVVMCLAPPERPLPGIVFAMDDVTRIFGEQRIPPFLYHRRPRGTRTPDI